MQLIHLLRCFSLNPVVPDIKGILFSLQNFKASVNPLGAEKSINADTLFESNFLLENHLSEYQTIFYIEPELP